MDITRNPPVLLPNSQQNSSGGGNNPTPFSRAPPPFDFSRMFYSNEINQASRSKYTGSNPGVSQTQFIMSSDLSYGCGSGSTHHSLASRAFASAGANAVMSPAAFASSGSVVATGFPTDSSSYLGTNGGCQFNTDEFRISRDGLPPSSGDALLNVQGYNLSPHPCSSVDKVGQYDRRSLLTCEEGKRPYLADGSGGADVMNGSKKPRIAPTEHVEPKNPQKKELSLFMDVDDSISASETCGAEEEGPVDVDLSLHL
ncbi:uncharacterized protein LOC110424595 isoform X3 [Herrania umbratica]|nr:uncharacterized protein LOC110424595 isoform X3 [Herrania umbratica]